MITTGVNTTDTNKTIQCNILPSVLNYISIHVYERKPKVTELLPLYMKIKISSVSPVSFKMYSSVSK